jgi:hypothetical protein
MNVASLKKIKAGDILYDVHTYRMGNTLLRSTGIWYVRVISVDQDGALVSWNGNREEHYSEEKLRKLRTVKPVMIETIMGSSRIATRAEIAAMKEPKP